MNATLRILFVLDRLSTASETALIDLLGRNVERHRLRLDVVACAREPDFHARALSDRIQRTLEAARIDVDITAGEWETEARIAFLADRVAGYDIVVAGSNVPDLHAALARIAWRPCVIELGSPLATVGIDDASRDTDIVAFRPVPPPFVDLDDYVGLNMARGRARRRWNLGSDVPVFGYVARLDPTKRIEDFIRAAARVRVAFPSARFKVFGGPDASSPGYADEMRKLVIDHFMTESIEFMGEADDLPTVLAGLDALCWLSEEDGLPRIVVEAGAAGLAVIATARPSTPFSGTAAPPVATLVEDGVSGLLVPLHDPDAVAWAMIRLLGDAGWRRGLGAELRRRVETGFSAETIVPRWVALFEERAAARQPAPRAGLFNSFIQGGFECSSHRRKDGRRLDLIASTGHDIHAAADYRTLAGDGLLTVRDGVRWHLIEPEPGRRDWSSFLAMLHAARDAGTQVIWDLLHYGWPDDIDIWSPQFCERFRDFARDLALLVQSETDAAPFYCPVNEISFFSWGGGDVGYLNPFAHDRGRELKAQLARASIMAMEAILEVEPRARFVHAEPVIHVIHHPGWPQERATANAFRMAQFEAWDMVAGRVCPELGGRPRLLDVMGLNYYSNNQWCHLGPTVHADDPNYKPFRSILAETYARYGRPLFISETGREGDLRPEWFDMVCREVQAARLMGVPVEGICLYPVLDHPGWDDDRDCANGLYRQGPVPGRREPFQPLMARVRRWRTIFDEAHRQSTPLMQATPIVPTIRRPVAAPRPARPEGEARSRALLPAMQGRGEEPHSGG
jgi:glycosyltransferase involved in cell wall biosynthesis